MKAATIKFTAAMAFLLALAATIRATNDDGWLTVWFMLFTFMGLPVLILAWVDLGSALRDSEHPTLLKGLGILFGLPQALLGLASILVGGALLGWVLYNSLIATQPQYSGGFLTFGVGPALVAFGAHWVLAAFRGMGKAE